MDLNIQKDHHFFLEFPVHVGTQMFVDQIVVIVLITH